MASKDRWLEVRKDGRLFVHSENDGARFLRCGPEAETEEVTLEQLEFYSRTVMVNGKISTKTFRQDAEEQLRKMGLMEA